MIFEWTYGAINQDAYQFGARHWNWSGSSGGGVGAGWAEAVSLFLPGADDTAMFHAGAFQADVFIPGADMAEVR